MKSTIDVLNTKVKQKNADIDKKKKSIAAKNQEIDGLKKRVQPLEAELDAKGKRIAGLESDLQTKKSEIDKLNSRHQQTTAQLAKNKKVVRDVGNRIVTRTYRTTAKSIATLPAEAIPIIGIAAVLTDVTLDLGAACFDIRDMNKLFIELGIPEAMPENKVNAFCNQKIPDVKAATSQAFSDAVAKKDDLLQEGSDLFKQLMPALDAYF
jgi:predicted RNase H-like nuclease (RuvC/YqgF family)